LLSTFWAGSGANLFSSAPPTDISATNFAVAAGAGISATAKVPWRLGCEKRVTHCSRRWPCGPALWFAFWGTRMVGGLSGALRAKCAGGCASLYDDSATARRDRCGVGGRCR